MARITRPLTNNEILKAKPKEKDFTLHDGDGLFLLIKTSGKKLLRFHYQLPANSSRSNLSLGSYPALTLAAARQIRDQYLSLLAGGSTHRSSKRKCPNYVIFIYLIEESHYLFPLPQYIHHWRHLCNI